MFYFLHSCFQISSISFSQHRWIRHEYFFFDFFQISTFFVSVSSLIQSNLISFNTFINSSSKRKRHNYIVKQRKFIRKFWFDYCLKQNRSSSYAIVRQIYRRKYENDDFSNDVIRRCIDSHEFWLDDIQIQNSHCRNRQEKWKEMKNALFQWQLKKKKQRVSINENILKEWVLKIWNKFAELISEYQKIKNTIKKFKTSNDWLDEYKTRHYTKKHVRHDESDEMNKQQLK